MSQKTEIDIIILSYAQNEELKMITTDCIRSLIESEDPGEIKFNIIVIESQNDMRPYQFEHTTTLYPDEEFGYHRYMNLGIKSTCAPYVCLCNNDLLFHKGWATEILQPFINFDDVYSASPACSILTPKMGIELDSGYRLGYRIRQEIAGWCLFIRRDLFKIIGELDPNYKFWCADNDYANTLWALKLNHVLVTSSIVDHLENKTLHNQSAEHQFELTEKESIYYNKKWFPRMGEGWTEY